MQKISFKRCLVAVMFLATTVASAQVTIGNGKVPEDFSVLELVNNELQGLRLPQMTTEQRNKLETETQAFIDEKTNLAMGLQIFNTTTKCVETWNGTTWIQTCPPEGPVLPPVTEIPPGGGKSVGPWSTTQWVGAFWRNSQTGERIIRATNTLAWSVSVDEDYRSWIVVDNVRGNNTTLWTDTPDDAELYQLTSGGETLDGGTGDILFRIGLKSKNTGAPRYGIVTLTVGDENYRLFIRQGEAADYVFRNNTAEDADNIGTLKGIRTRAAKFSPYNLTNADLRDDSPPLGVPTAVNGGAFVEYPTQAGAFWQWGTSILSGGNLDLLRHAYHPTKPTTISGWDLYASVDATETWSDFTDENSFETCPTGFRRPTVLNSPSLSTGTAPASESELMQSLFKVTFDNNDSQNNSLNENSDNHRYFGYYADGFFDRRPIETQGGTNPRSKGVVSHDNKDAAYIGLLFTNPATNASLFVPASGRRNAATDTTNGSLYDAGNNSYAWTSSVALFWAWYLNVNSSSAEQVFIPRMHGLTVRCVSEF